MKILFVSKYDKIMASARYRVFFIADILKNNYNYKTDIFIIDKYNKKILNSLNKKFLRYIVNDDYDVIYFHKYFDEKLAQKYKLKNKKLILSIDDLPADKLINFNPELVDYVLCGSEYLQKLYNEKGFKTIFFPTLIPKKFLNINYDIHKPLVISWIGSSGGDKFLLPIFEYLEKVNNNLIFNIVTSKQMFDIDVIKQYKFVNFIEWKMNKEYKYFDDTDIILMPLDDSVRSLAKGGFKLLQGMFRGSIPLAYNTNANKNYVKDGINGFLYKNNEEFFDKLNLILSMDKNKLINIKKEGFKFIQEKELFLEQQINTLLKEINK